eukprot:COSAG02_NODE_4353_length_5461_cov_3.183141_4_plen_101_part_00
MHLSSQCKFRTREQARNILFCSTFWDVDDEHTADDLRLIEYNVLLAKIHCKLGAGRLRHRLREALKQWENTSQTQSRTGPSRLVQAQHTVRCRSHFTGWI